MFFTEILTRNHFIHSKQSLKACVVTRGKLLHIGWINNKVLLNCTGNYIQYSVTNHNGKECEKEGIYIYIHIYTHTHTHTHMHIESSMYSKEIKPVNSKGNQP